MTAGCKAEAVYIYFGKSLCSYHFKELVKKVAETEIGKQAKSKETKK